MLGKIEEANWEICLFMGLNKSKLPYETFITLTQNQLNFDQLKLFKYQLNKILTNIFMALCWETAASAATTPKKMTLDQMTLLYWSFRPQWTIGISPNVINDIHLKKD